MWLFALKTQRLWGASFPDAGMEVTVTVVVGGDVAGEFQQNPRREKQQRRSKDEE